MPNKRSSGISRISARVTTKPQQCQAIKLAYAVDEKFNWCLVAPINQSEKAFGQQVEGVFL
jgi:hypothetical protein